MRSFQLEKETGEKVGEGCEVGSAQEVSGFLRSLSATYPASACILILVLCFLWDACSSTDAGSILQDVSSASRSAFTQHRVWVMFSHQVRIKPAQLQRLARVLLTQPSLPKQEREAEPCNHTWLVYEVTIPCLRRGTRLCVHR